MIERHLLRCGEVYFIGDTFGKRASESRFTANPAALDINESLVCGPGKFVGYADTKGRHVIEEKICPMLGRDYHQHVRARSFEAVS
jgi:hypothetical protein